MKRELTWPDLIQDRILVGKSLSWQDDHFFSGKIKSVKIVTGGLEINVTSVLVRKTEEQEYKPCSNPRLTLTFKSNHDPEIEDGQIKIGRFSCRPATIHFAPATT